jgi:hypothetical protein
MEGIMIPWEEYGRPWPAGAAGKGYILNQPKENTLV